MKYQFDLLPQKYKSLPSNMLAIILAFLAIVASISAITSVSIKNEKELAKIQKKIDADDSNLRVLIEKISNLQPPMDEINSLKSSITFINRNLNTPGSGLVDFFADLEATVPDRVVITDLNPKKFNTLEQEFIISGEASTIFDVLEFAKRLEQSKKFSAMLETTNNIDTKENSVQKFSLAFTYKAISN